MSKAESGGRGTKRVNGLNVKELSGTRLMKSGILVSTNQITNVSLSGISKVKFAEIVLWFRFEGQITDTVDIEQDHSTN